MYKLIVLRAAPLFLRPAAVLLERAFVPNGHILVFVLPIAAMALTVSSIPVHLDYFRSHPGLVDYKRQSREYASAISLLTLASAIVLVSVLAVAPLGLDLTLIIATCFVFISEKLADETSRAFEFRKEFGKWFGIQAIRSSWLVLPISAHTLGMSYSFSFLITSILVSFLMLGLFIFVSGLLPTLSLAGLALIRNNLVFLVGSALPASYRQVPRIVVSKLFPEQAHVFLAVAQLSQGVSLIYNVKFQVPYRKLIARRTLAYQRRLRPITGKLAVMVTFVAIIYLPISLIDSTGHLGEGGIGLALMPLMAADALAFGVLSTHLGLLPWFTKKSEALFTYLLCLAAMGTVISLISFELVPWLSIFHIPTATIAIGMIWLAIIMRRHFARAMEP